MSGGFALCRWWQGYFFIMYLQVKKIELVPDKFGQHIKITMVGLYEDNGKWVRWVKLNDETVIDAMAKIQIPFEP